MTPIVFSTHRLHPDAAARIRDAADLRIASALDGATLKGESRDAAVVIVRAALPADMFAGKHSIRAAVRHGAGLDMIPIEAASEAGVLVANVPGANAVTVAEHVIYTTMALLRRLRMLDRDLRSSGWLAARNHSDLGHDLTGRSIGIVGMGAVGSELARIARHGFGLTVFGANRSGRAMPEGVEPLPLDDLVRCADIVVLCCPLTPETTGLMSRARIASMRPDAVLVNVSRGPVVDDDALIEALHERRILGAALDVFQTQPLPPDHPYLGFDNVIVTPHMAGITEESMRRMGLGAADETLRVLAGDLPVNLRNPNAVAAYRRRFSH